PPARRTWRSSRWSPRGRKILVVKSSCFRQSAIVGLPKNPCAHWFISAATLSAVFRKMGSRWIASFRFRWFSSDIVDTWPSASSPSNIPPSEPLVARRHRRPRADRGLAVEHPAVGAGQQRVGDVADALLGA